MLHHVRRADALIIHSGRDRIVHVTHQIAVYKRWGSRTVEGERLKYVGLQEHIHGAMQGRARGLQMYIGEEGATRDRSVLFRNRSRGHSRTVHMW